MQNLKSKFKNLIYFGFLIVIFHFLALSRAEGFIFHLRSASAQTMSNRNYIIQTEGINTISNTTKSGNPQSTIDKPDSSISKSVNFEAESGFKNLASGPPFSVSLSSDLVDFGILSPTNPIIRTVDLSINSSAAYGYSVITFENESLAAVSPSESDSEPKNKTFIPDTTCDNGRCDTQNASGWINALTYGFGYRCDSVAGADCDNSFASPNFYKHLPNIANNDNPTSIMAGIGLGNKESRISYKVNISGTQAKGIYSNIVTYIAVPNF